MASNYDFTSFPAGGLTINPDPTAITLDNKLSGTNFDCIANQYTATLKDTVTNTGLPGIGLTLTIGTQSTTAATDANGVAMFILTLDQTPGSVTESVGLTGGVSAWTDGNRIAPSTVSRSFTINPSPYAGPLNGTSLYTGPSFSWTTSPTSSTTTLTLNATIKDTSVCPGNIAKAKVSFFVSSNNGSSFSPVSSAQNLPVGLVNPADPTVGTAAASAQYNIGSNLAITLVIKVVVGGEYTLNSDEFNVPVVIAVPGQPNTLTAGGKLGNTATTGLTGSLFPVATANYYANGYLGNGDGITSGGLANFAVAFGGFVKCNNTRCTNPQGQINATFHSYNRPDGSVDTAVHHYYMKTNSLLGWGTTSPGSGFFSAKTNLSEITGGTNTGLDGGGTMQMIFARTGATYTYTSGPSAQNVTLTCPTSAANGCASIILYRSNGLGGGVWFSSAWGPVAAGGLPQTIMKQMASGTIAYTAE